MDTNKISQLQDLIKNMKLVPLESGFAVSSSFFDEFERAKLTHNDPGPVHNNKLKDKKGLKPNLENGKQLRVVSYEVWSFIQDNFGGGPEIRIPILEDGTPELYQLRITVRNGRVNKEIKASRSWTMEEFKQKVISALSLSSTIDGIFSFQSSSTKIECTGRVGDHFKQDSKIVFIDSSDFSFPSIKSSQKNKKAKSEVQNTAKTIPSQISTPQISSPEISLPQISTHLKTSGTPRGLKNLGNTCYMNSSLQCLMSLPGFIASLPRILSEAKRPNVISAFSNFVHSYEPSIIKNAVASRLPIFNNRGQQDSHEFTCGLLDIIHDDSPKNGLFESLFYGHLLAETTCASCHQTTQNFELFNSLCLSLSASRKSLYIPFNMEEPIERVVTVSDQEKTVKQGNTYLEIPNDLEENEGVAIIQMKTIKGRQIGHPILFKVPLNQEVDTKNLVWERVKCMWEFGRQTFVQQNIVFSTCPTKFSLEHQIELQCSPENEIEKRKPLCKEIVILQMKDKFFEIGLGFRNLRTHVAECQLSVDELLSSFFSPFVLDENNKWLCEKCHTKTCATRKFQMNSLPQYLILQLKRFNAVGGRRMDKDTTPVLIPHQLSFSIHESNKRYQLVAVSNHSGNLYGGHYTAIGKRGENWYNFNDNRVTMSGPPIDRSSAAYVLFYSLE